MQAAMATWLVTIAQLPTEDPAARMRVLRTLESLGAAETIARGGRFVAIPFEHERSTSALLARIRQR